MRSADFLFHGLRLLALLCLLTAAGACGGDDSDSPGTSGNSPFANPTTPTSPTNPPTTPSAPNGTMSATVDGSAWSAGFIIVQYQPNVAPLLIRGLDVFSDSARQVTVVPPSYRTGTYFACPGFDCAFFDYAANNGLWASGPVGGSSGSVTLSTLTAHNAIGTFSYVAVDQFGTKRTVTNGRFNVTY